MTDFHELYPKELKDRPYFTTDINVRWEEMDINGHINYAVYLDYFSEGRLDAIGNDLVASLRQENIGPVIYKIEVEYLKEMHHPDAAHIVTWIEKVESKTRIQVRQNIYSKRSGKLVSKGTFHSVFMDTAKRRPTRIPDAIIARFKLNEYNIYMQFQ